MGHPLKGRPLNVSHVLNRRYCKRMKSFEQLEDRIVVQWIASVLG
jgi:hypothetical protein